MSSRGKDPFRIPHVKAIKATALALLVEHGTQGDQLWVPKSVVHDDSEVFDDGKNAEGDLVVFEWWAESKGLL